MYRYQPFLFQPVPSRLRFSLSELMEEVRAAYFPAIDGEVEVRFAAEQPLAYIWRHSMGRDRHMVVFHAVLNHPQTPIEVARFICKHELTHIVRPPRVIDGYYEQHPPEFWDMEYLVAPERWAAWAWINKNLRRCLRERDSGLSVVGEWRRMRDTVRSPYTPALPFGGERWAHACPGGGAQLRLPPDWPVRPLPACRIAGVGD